MGTGSPSYASGINGYGSCLYLNASASQTVTIFSPPFLNMAQTSFSLVAWVFATSFNNALNNNSRIDSAIFGQSENFTIDRSLHISVRNQKIYLGFFSDDISGNQILLPGVWYHVRISLNWSKVRSAVLVESRLDGIRLRLFDLNPVCLCQWRAGCVWQPERSLSRNTR